MIGGLFKSASRVALVAAAGILAGGVAAQAADLGGNCCADLEERVAELEATTARKGNRKVSLTVYGRITKALLWHDDEWGYREGKATVRDNAASPSLFGFRGNAQIRPDLSAGYVLEIGVNENWGTGTGFGKDGKDLNEGDAFTIRHNYVYLDHQQFGRVSLGQQSQATDGVFVINLANAMVTGGEMDEAVNVLGKHFITTFKNPHDGGRKQGVIYRSPTLAGFILSAGYNHGAQDDADAPYHPNDATDTWEVALRYAGEFNGVRIAAGVGYRHDESATNVETEVLMASASVMHTPTGLFLSGGYGDQDSDTPNDRRTAWWAMAGIEKNYFGPGNTTLFAEYGESDLEENAWDRRDGSYWGLGVTQTIDAAATDLYLNFRNYEKDSHNGYEGHDANVVVGGMRIQF